MNVIIDKNICSIYALSTTREGRAPERAIASRSARQPNFLKGFDMTIKIHKIYAFLLPDGTAKLAIVGAGENGQPIVANSLPFAPGKADLALNRLVAGADKAQTHYNEVETLDLPF
jgi:hypothetical protein